jgi:hypothetical protein
MALLTLNGSNMKTLHVTSISLCVVVFFALARPGTNSPARRGQQGMPAGETQREVPANVSLIDLIAQKEKFHNRRVMAEGFLILRDEGSALYLSKEDARYGITKNGLWVGFSTNLLNSIHVMGFSGKYVAISGTFDMHERGHMGLWSGKIAEIDSIHRLKPL